MGQLHPVHTILSLPGPLSYLQVSWDCWGLGMYLPIMSLTHTTPAHCINNAFCAYIIETHYKLYYITDRPESAPISTSKCVVTHQPITSELAFLYALIIDAPYSSSLAAFI